MSVKQKSIYSCDQCGEEFEDLVVWTEGVPYEGRSMIHYGFNKFNVGEQHYCSVGCLLDHIEGVLTAAWPVES